MKKLGAIVLIILASQSFAASPIVFEQNDRVVFAGGTFVERMARFGYLETALTLALHDKKLTFRNLGWSADTVRGESRGYDKPHTGYANLLANLRQAEPTLLFLAYGAAESWEADPEKFTTDYQRLLDDLKQLSARMVLVSPILQENWGKPMPDPGKHNADLKTHANAIRELAKKNTLPYLDLLGLVNPDAPKAKRLTMNSLQLNDAGHRHLARFFLEKLELPPRKDLDQQKGRRIRNLTKAKNDLYFYSWRPQNQTYIYSFRKHEQGRHAKDIPGFAPLVAKMEQSIRDELESLPQKIAPARDDRLLLWEDIKPSEKALQDAKSFHVPEDLELNIFASEPAIKNPVQSAWDEQGRLWVATAESYPHIAPGFVVNDKIIVLEDIDRDGVADRRQVFADGLLMPTAILPGHGGVYVGTSTEILHLRDTDGDGKADEKTILISGLGTEDTHHVVHGLRHTEDGRIGFTQSIYINTHAETPWGIRRLRKSGVWIFDPNTHDLEVFSYGLVNPWGHQTDDFGQSFMTDGAGGAGLHYAFPGAAYVTSAYHGRSEVLPGLNPGQPKHCGLEIISSKIFPEKYRGLLVTNDFRGHRTLSFRLGDKQSGFFSTQQEDLIHVASKGTDRHGAAGMYRPVDVDEGPDGALYVNDWSNHIIQHGEVDFHDKRRDHEHGRIWRLMPKGAKPLPYGERIKRKPIDWMKDLSSTETYVRRKARRLLIEKGGTAIGPQLIAEARKQKEDSILLEFIWVARSLRQDIPEDLFKRLADSDDFRIRGAALRLGYEKPEAIDDPHPRVRLEAVCSLRRKGDLNAIETMVRATDHETDRNLDFALREALKNLRSTWEGKTTFENHPTRLARVVSLTKSQAPLDGLLAALNEGKVPPEKYVSTLRALASAGQSKHLDAVLDATLSEDLDSQSRVHLIEGLAIAKTDRKLWPNKQRDRISSLFDHPQVGSAAVRLAAHWKLADAQEAAKNQLTSSSTSDLSILRRNTATLALFGNAGIQHLVAFARETERPQAALAALEAIAEADGATAARLAPDFLVSLPEKMDVGLLFTKLLRSKEAPKILAEGIAGKTLRPAFCLLGIRAASTSGRDLSGLVAALRKAGNLKPMKQQLSAQEMKEVISKVENHGNPELGELIYRRKALACVACHAIGGFGSKVGPDLISIGASAPVDYLVESLLQPNKKIKEGFHMTIVNTKDNKAFAGLELSSSKEKVVIRDASGKIIEITSSQVKSKSIVPTSLMPPGLTASLTSEEFVHLVSFMSKLGKDGPFRFPKETFVRSAEVVSAEFARTGKHSGETKSSARTKIQAFVDGRLPVSEIPKSTDGKRYLSFRLQNDALEEIRFVLSETKGLTLYLRHFGKRKKLNLSRNDNMAKHSLKAGDYLYIVTLEADFPADSLRIQLHSTSPGIRLPND
ncbi:MAG: hypothetical protein CMI31_14925 [Opitutae bacterium]|nr:hypothetical protein [Opitutae bacterium]